MERGWGEAKTSQSIATKRIIQMANIQIKSRIQYKGNLLCLAFFKRCLCVLIIGIPHLIFAQKSDLKIMIAGTVSYLDKAENYSDECNQLLKKCVATKDKELAKKMAEEAMKIALKAKEQSDLAEKRADQIEVEAKKIGCFTGASEADDAEDYCRQLGYHTFEISIYTKKATSELELVYIQEYIYKALNYANLAYEALKNARVEIENAVKDVDTCD